MWKKTALFVSLIPLAACATNGPAPSADPCGPFRAIYVGKDDVLTEATARDLLAHNRTGATLCGWGRTP